MEKAFHMLNNLYDYRCTTLSFRKSKAVNSSEIPLEFYIEISFWIKIPVLYTIFLWFRLRSTTEKSSN